MSDQGICRRLGGAFTHKHQLKGQGIDLSLEKQETWWHKADFNCEIVTRHETTTTPR